MRSHNCGRFHCSPEQRDRPVIAPQHPTPTGGARSRPRLGAKPPPNHLSGQSITRTAADSPAARRRAPKTDQPAAPPEKRWIEAESARREPSSLGGGGLRPPEPSAGSARAQKEGARGGTLGSPTPVIHVPSSRDAGRGPVRRVRRGDRDRRAAAPPPARGEARSSPARSAPPAGRASRSRASRRA